MKLPVIVSSMLKEDVSSFYKMNGHSRNPCSHGHRTCQTIYANPAIQAKLQSGKKVGIATLVYLHWYSNATQPVVLLGKERYGKYQNEYNLASGSMERSDNGCFILAALRELYEETGIKIDWKTFDSHFKHTGKVRFIIHHGTPVLICKFNGLKRTKLNQTLTGWSRDHAKPHCFKEVWRVDFFNPFTLNQLEGKPGDGYNIFRVSNFATSVISQAVQQGYLNQ